LERESACRFDSLISPYLDDELEPEERAQFEEHLAECETCRAEVEQMRRVVILASHSLQSARCLQAHEKADYVHGRLSPERKRDVEEHLKHCRNCRSDIKELQALAGQA